jgi:hypothetical protein
MHRHVVERLARLRLVLLFLSIIVFRIQPRPFRWGSTAKVGGFSINSQSRPFVALREMTLAR